MGFIGTLAMMLAIPLVALAQAVPPETVDQAVGFLPKLIEGIVTGNWAVAGGVVVMIAMVAVRQFLLPKVKVDAQLLPVITSVVGSVAFAGMGLATGVPVTDALMNGLVASLLAGGTWSLLGKYLAKLALGDKFQEPVEK